MTTIAFTGDPEADRLLGEDPLALLIGMLLDQQFPMERAFAAPAELRRRLDGTLDVREIADMDPDALKAVFTGPPALHRFPGSMAARVQDLAHQLVQDYDGKADRVWLDAGSGKELFDNIRRLPGFGDQKARIFTALLAKRLGVTPEGWEEQAGDYAQDGYRSVADIDGPDALARVREYKRAAKAEAKAKAKPRR